jgi:hypothetical protein
MGDPTTPTKDSFHGALPPRGLAGTASSSFSGGRFGRMFRHLPAAAPSDDSLAKLGQAMIQELKDGELDKPLGTDDDDENTSKLDDGSLRLPAGYTYFGQFVDHDITFDPVSSLTRQNDPDGLNDFRTPRFDLDSLYGRGPADQPYLYKDGLRLSLGNSLSDDEKSPAAGPDLQRDANGRAIIGDPRNDENLIVSQLQVTFIKFHNAVLDKVENENPKLPPEDRFKLAQREVRWHYQWVVIHDYLRRLVGQDVIDDILPMKPYVVPLAKAGIPVPELRFSVAAYRFGHSMARPSYEINQVAKTDPAIAGVNRIPLFSLNEGKRQSLKGFRPLPRNWGVQWRFFLPGIKDGIEPDPRLPQPGYKLDAQLSNPLGTLPTSTAEAGPIGQGLDPSLARDLAVRNLIRGKSMGLPSGQDISRAMGMEPLSDAELFEKIELDGPAKEDLAGRAPLWFYILKESEKRAESAHLGPVGGRIVAEVLIGLLAGDPLSFLGVQPDWTPTLGEGTDFTLSDLINIAIPAPETPTPAPYSG